MSVVDLIGEVPSHWSVKPLRLIGRLLKGTGGSKEDVVESGVPCVRYGDLYTTHNNFIEQARTYLTEDRAQDYTPIEYGDVLFAASGETIEEIGKSAVNLLHDARCGGDVVIFRPTQPTIARFLGYAMDAAPVAVQKSLAGRGTTVKHIYPDELRDVVIAVPPVGEQQVIADYLDRETARLDALVAAKERLLGLLAEKRRALITRAVTCGLDPRAPLRESGISWLGKIPAHWELKRLKHVGRSIIGLTFDPADTVTDGSGVLVLRASNVRDQQIVLEDNLFVLMDIPAPLRTRVGDILICSRSGSRALIGKNALIDESSSGLTFGAFMTVFRSPHNEYLFYVFNSPLFDYQAGAFSTSTINQLTVETLNGMEIPLPPAAEQNEIVANLRQDTARLDRLVEANERTIALLKERRGALIAAAVTGQIDVEISA